MKKALVDPGEIKCDGAAIIEVNDIGFEVSLPFFWVDCPDDTERDVHYYARDKTIRRIDAQPCYIKDKAKQALLDTDWSVLTDVDGPDRYLENRSDFIFYRNTMRNIAIDPKPVAKWLDKPDAIWAVKSV
jgi:hypothetical protein